MPDDPIQDNQDETTSQPEESKPVEENPKPEENPTPEPPKEEPKPEEKPAEEKKSEDSRPSEPEIKIVEKEVIKEVKVVDEAELGKQLDEKLKSKLLENKKKADEARSQRRKDNLNQIVELAKKKEINNQDVRDLLQVSQSTATNYLTELAKSGRLKSEKKAKAKVYKS
ncbi:MAG: peptidase family protein [Candidatus Levybacteria bacterium]|nr:peptidase family protein [Candidatus Levybacteria bacterium]